MKTILLFALLFIVAFPASSSAQERKENKDKSLGKSSIKNIPDKTPVSTSELQSIFRKKQGETISVRFNDDLIVTGTIQEKVQHNSGTTSINFKSPDYPGVLFNFSSQKKGNGEEFIQARIISRQSADALVLIKENNRYFLKHTPQDKLIAE
jgi:hypothetical protein